jgi:hypothetical protein
MPRERVGDEHGADLTLDQLRGQAQAKLGNPRRKRGWYR